MFFILEKSDENIITNCGKGIKLSLKEFSYLKDFEKLMIEMIKDDKLTKLLNLGEKMISLIIEVVINDKDETFLKEKMIEMNCPLFSLIINQVKIYKRKYKKLLDIDNCDLVIMISNKTNFIECLELSKKIKKEVIIEGTTISLAEYKELLTNYDESSLENVKIKYQDNNNPITISELRETADIVNKTISDVKKYNLSPLEKIIYVYDVVKKREYKKSESSKESRDLDRVLKGDKIVCVGYSNLFNAILRGLGINAIPLISSVKKHQISLVYIKDPKYNIDGMYTFDPTWDRKKEDTYIGNYKYFGLTLQKSHIKLPITIKLDINLTFKNILSMFSLENDIEENLDKISELEEFFKFVNEDKFEEFKEEIDNMYYLKKDSKKVREIYKKFIKKYKPEEISSVVFMMALYQVRIVEYYNGIIEGIDIEDIIDTVATKTVFQKTNYKVYSSDMEKILDNMFSYDETSEMLEDKIDRSEIVRRNQNIRLLKVLRNRQKQLTGDKK